MKNTADVRKDNIVQILNIIRDGKEHTVLSVSKSTGLSVATCNTLLKMLVNKNQAIGTKKQLNGIGRSSVVYRINNEYFKYLSVKYLQGDKKLQLQLNYLYGNNICECEFDLDGFDSDFIINKVNNYVKEKGILSAILVSLPLSYWDKTKEIEEKIQKDTNIKTFVSNKYNFIAKGYEEDGLNTLVDLKTINPIVINIKNNDLLAGKKLQRVNYDLLFGDINNIDNLARSIAINILYSFPDVVTIVGDIDLNQLKAAMAPYTESPLPEFKKIDEINSACEKGIGKYAVDILIDLGLKQ